MNFALLGADAEMVRLAEAIAASPRHRVVALCAAGVWEPRLRELFPHAQCEDTADYLWHHPVVEGVLVNAAPFDAARDEVLRKLVQAGQFLILTHPATNHLMALELEMIRADSAAHLDSYLPELLEFPAQFDLLAGKSHRQPESATAAAGDDRGVRRAVRP